MKKSLSKITSVLLMLVLLLSVVVPSTTTYAYAAHGDIGPRQYVFDFGEYMTNEEFHILQTAAEWFYSKYEIYTVFFTDTPDSVTYYDSVDDYLNTTYYDSLEFDGDGFLFVYNNDSAKGGFIQQFGDCETVADDNVLVYIRDVSWELTEGNPYNQLYIMCSMMADCMESYYSGEECTGVLDAYLAGADNNTATSGSNNGYLEKATVFDEADLLTDAEEDILANKAADYSAIYGVDVVFLTEDNTNGKSAMTYSDDFLDALIDENGYSEDGILFFIDMDNREIYINTVGECISALNDAEIERVLDAGYDHVADEEYYDCLAAMAEEAFSRMDDHFFGTGDTGEVKPTVGEVLMPTGQSILFSLIATAVAMLGGWLFHNAAMKRPSAKMYQSTFSVVRRQESYIGSHETVQRGYYKSDSSGSSGRSSGGGSSHRSSSGRSHGGGGRRF